MDALMRLAAAAALVYKEATGQIAKDPAVIDQLSTAIAQHVTLYAHKGWGDSLEVVPANVLQDAVFMQGGELMRSRNVTYSSLSVRQTELSAVLDLLVERYKKG